MSTRYVWNKNSVAYEQEIGQSNEYEQTVYTAVRDVYVCFSTGVTRASDGTFSMTGSIKEYSRLHESSLGYYEDATVYKYAAPNRAGNKFYIENNEDHVPSFWFISTDGLHWEAILRANKDYAAPQYVFKTYSLTAVQGDSIGLVSSGVNDAYPQDGPKSGFWYTYKGSDSIDPLSVTYNTDRPERGKPVTVTVNPAPIGGEAPQWTASAATASPIGAKVAYGGGWFVAVGGQNNARITRSSDGGKTWSAVSNSLYDASGVTYANGKFVLVGLHTAAYSTDNGATWTAAASFPDGQWHAACYGGGKFVAVDSAKSKAMYSSDGNVWTEISLPGGKGWLCIAYGNGRFVAATTGKAAYSDNLADWSEVQIRYGGDIWRSIVFADEKFVIVGTYGSAYSTNAESWTITQEWGNLDLQSVAYGAGKFVAVGMGDTTGGGLSETTISLYSTDAQTWETMVMPASKNWAGVVYGDDRFVAVSMQNDGAAYLPDKADLGYTISYLYQYSANNGTSWITVGSATADTQKEITVPDKAEQFMARVRAQDDIGFTSADYVAGENLTVQTMLLWVGVDGVARRGRKMWVGVNGEARPIVHGWVGDENGKARRWF